MQIDMAIEASYQLHCQGNRKAAVAFHLFCNDVAGAVLSFDLFEQLRLHGSPADNPAMMYHASCFVCCVRRIGRVLDAFSGNELGFPSQVSAVIKLENKKKKTFFQSFVEPRNAIEHIDGSVKEMTRFEAFNLLNDRFQIVNGEEVSINRQSLEKVLSVRDAIVKAIINDTSTGNSV